MNTLIDVQNQCLLIDKKHKELSVRRQCDLLGVSRSKLYYQPTGESEFNQELMRRLDEQYTRTPFYGVCRMTAYLCREGYEVGEKRVRRLLRKMGLEAVYPKPNLSKQHLDHKIYPNLLRGLEITQPNQVWSTDITYIRLDKGFVYLVAIIDWYSRYVLGWALSTTLEADFCIETLEGVLENASCEIFNTDQGSQFTTNRFTRVLIAKGIKVSMDGRGRALDNIFVERLWRSVKYEKVYLCDFQSVAEARDGLEEYFEFYNNERLHQSLDYNTPKEVHYAK